MSDLDRLRLEYRDRRKRLAGSDIYSPFNTANLFIYQQRQRVVLNLLRREGFFPLSRHNILEVGCGNGGVLLELLMYGATPTTLYGIDLLPDRVEEAAVKLPHLQLICADGQNIPYPTKSFDLILQYTVFSSILSDEIKQHLASEMIRVLRPSGMILWYDFWLNPINKQTKGIRPNEINRLFPGCRCEFHRITLAPPLARRVVPISWLLAFVLDSLKIFNTHYLVRIRQK